MMRRVLLASSLAFIICSCGDDRSDTGGAGSGVDTAGTNTTVGTGNGGNTYSGGDSINPQGGNATGQAVDSANGRPLGGDTAANRRGTGNQQRQ